MLFVLTMSILSFVRRPIWFRILVSLWALWFAAALSEVGPLGTRRQRRHARSLRPPVRQRPASVTVGLTLRLPEPEDRRQALSRTIARPRARAFTRRARRPGGGRTSTTVVTNAHANICHS